MNFELNVYLQLWKNTNVPCMKSWDFEILAKTFRSKIDLKSTQKQLRD